MKVNSIVFNQYQNIRRYGVVKEVRVKKDGWRSAKVAWVNDGTYERSMRRLDNLRNNQNYLEEYRIDQLRQIDAEAEKNTIKACLIMTRPALVRGVIESGNINQKLENL